VPIGITILELLATLGLLAGITAPNLPVDSPVGFNGDRVSARAAQHYATTVSGSTRWASTLTTEIIPCESRFFEQAVSPTGDYGLTQINRETWHEHFDFDLLLLDWQYNVESAYEIWLAQGWSAWSCYDNSVDVG
jgi:hypothetical protein